MAGLSLRYTAATDQPERDAMADAIELRAGALDCLLEPDPALKTAAVARLAARLAAGAIGADPAASIVMAGAIPGRPEQPQLVAPRLVGRRSMVTVAGRAMLIHALAHIEFNAMNLALDAVARFAHLPQRYYADWLAVAAEEAGRRIAGRGIEWRGPVSGH